ncbi:MAG: hypothetical protein ACI8V2_002818 [Candidatus Latescibacterota bacterium]|jgi:hypothetical protein
MRVALVNAGSPVGQKIARHLISLGGLGQQDGVVIVNCSHHQDNLLEDVTPLENVSGPEVVLCTGEGGIAADFVLVCPDARCEEADAKDVVGLLLPDWLRLGDVLAQSAGSFLGGVFVATDANEFAVDVLTDFMPPERVVGLGAYLDACFLCGQLAGVLGVDRERIRASVGGGQKWGSVPLLSTVYVLGLSDVVFQNRLEAAGLMADNEQFFAEFLRARKQIQSFISVGQREVAQQRLSSCQKGVMACLNPLLMTEDALCQDTVASLIQLIYMLRAGDPIMMGAQVRRPWGQIDLEEALPVGRPCLVGVNGVIDELELQITELERAALKSSAKEMKRAFDTWPWPVNTEGLVSKQTENLTDDRVTVCGLV